MPFLVDIKTQSCLSIGGATDARVSVSALPRALAHIKRQKPLRMCLGAWRGAGRESGAIGLAALAFFKKSEKWPAVSQGNIKRLTPAGGRTACRQPSMARLRFADLTVDCRLDALAAQGLQAQTSRAGGCRYERDSQGPRLAAVGRW